VLSRRDHAEAEVGRLLARAAHAIQRHAADVEREAGDERGVAGDVEALLARLVDAAEDDVLDLDRIDPGPRHDRAQDLRGEVVRAHGGQLPVPAPDGRAHGLDDDDVPHPWPPGPVALRHPAGPRPTIPTGSTRRNGCGSRSRLCGKVRAGLGAP
jgi:hypothetical protein